MLRNVVLSAALVAGFAAGAQAGSLLVSAPLPVANGNSYRCAVVNVGAKEIEAVEVKMLEDGNTLAASMSCTSLPVGEMCIASSTSGDSINRFCTVGGVTKKNVRGSLCNTSTGVCVPIQ